MEIAGKGARHFFSAVEFETFDQFFSGCECFISCFGVGGDCQFAQPLHVAEQVRTASLDEDSPQEVAEQSRSEEHTSELQSRGHLVCCLLLEKKNPRPCRRI